MSKADRPPGHAMTHKDDVDRKQRVDTLPPSPGVSQQGDAQTRPDDGLDQEAAYAAGVVLVSGTAG